MKNISTLVIVFVLICCSFSALTIATNGTANQNSNLDTISSKSSGSQASSSAEYLLLEENFTDGNMPPEGDSGDWTLQQTNPDETWYIDSTVPYTKPYCGTINREENEYLQDEWLITPSLDFLGDGHYESITLGFHWYTCYYTSIYKRYVEFNISVSTDGGATWTNIWSFDDMNVGGNPFTDWMWYESNYLDKNPIPLSDYIGENDVRIAFQYYSNTTTEADQQEFSIDDINVIAKGPGKDFIADAGGPYSWWWPMQYEYLPNGVRFHGNVTNGTLVTQYLWDFGDGDTNISKYNQNPIHFYTDIGIYNVTLTAKDDSYTPPRININRTTLTLFLLKPPAINITARMISFGIKAAINNAGEYNATYVNWTINITWGILQHEKTVANGTIENIGIGSSATIQSKPYFFGFGIIHIIVSAYPENQPGLVKPFKGFKIGPLVFVVPEK
ncbi:MAG: PKD domain-containing protein [Euryarchaeota archaeon]|nr:PKD domain-containing protein [Euryarchaeota archaeon]